MIFYKEIERKKQNFKKKIAIYQILTDPDFKIFQFFFNFTISFQFLFEI